MMSENQTKSPPKRVIAVSSIVGETEAELFDQYIESVHKLSEAFKMLIEIDCIKITRAAKKVLGDDTTTEVCGSFSKGTNIYGSDLDFYIDTTYPVSVESRLTFVEELKHVFNESNVGLGRLAIHVRTEVCDIDIVCSNTDEYGVRPRPNEKIHENAPVKYAARCLKEWSKHNIRGKVKGYMLEEMALAVFLAYPSPDQFGSGGLQLFLSVLQTMVDSEEFGSSIYGLRGGSGCTKELRDAAKLTLHQFLMSHPIRGGFQSVAEMALWVCSTRDNDIETIAGKVFSWMALPSVDDIGSTSLCASTVHRFSSISSSQQRTSPRISLSSHEIDLLKTSKLGKYLLTGGKQKTPGIVPHEREPQSQGTGQQMKTSKNSKKKNKNEHKQEVVSPSLNPSTGAHVGQLVGNLMMLYQMATDGDELAIDMVELRSQWMLGEILLEEQNYSQAIARFAAVLRLTTANADPFSGEFRLGVKRYTTAIREVQAKDPYNEDACLIEAMVFAAQDNIMKAIEVLENRIRRGTNDALGLLYTCGTFYGNRHLWKESFEYFCRCYEIDKEPIFCYWKATALKNMITGVNAEVQPIIDLFEEYLNGGNRRGRKYAQAAYERTLLKLLMAASTKDANEVRKLEERAAECGVIAVELENMTLPIFPPLECDAKMLVLAWLKARSSRDKMPAAPAAKKGTNVDVRKEEANQLFKAHEYLEAIRIYSDILTAEPDNYKVRSNRVAAFCALGYFSKAIDDGLELVRINPSWAKGHYRLGTAYLGNGQWDAAKSCFEEADRLSPDHPDIEQQYQTCLEEQQLQDSGRDAVASVSIPIDLTTLPCAKKIQHWSCVKFVDSRGAGDYRSVTDALYATRCEAAVTLVLLPGVHHDPVDLSFVDTVIDDDYTRLDTEQVQILGWFPTKEVPLTCVS